VDPVNTTVDPLDRKLSWDQVRELHQNDLFTIGGHTHTHIIMSFETPKKMEAEIDLSLKLLRDKSGIETIHYAYPQGQKNHYNETVIKALKQRGIVCSPTAIEGQNTKETDLFDLFRTMMV
jgi:peptidoglycan/xylan/chitin deacetylase (PgdA/CDA1 family)